MPLLAPSTARDVRTDDPRGFAPRPPVPVRPARGVRASELPPAARCLACGERDARVLRSVKLEHERVVLCANDRERLRATWVRPADAVEAQLLLLDVLE